MTDILAADGVAEEELLRLAYALEQKSEHPLAKAILLEAEERGLAPEEVSDFQALPGNGLTAVLEGAVVRGGNHKFIKQQNGDIRGDEAEIRGACRGRENTSVLQP